MSEFFFTIQRKQYSAKENVSPVPFLCALHGMSETGSDHRLTAVEIFAIYDEDGSNSIDVGEIEVCYAYVLLSPNRVFLIAEQRVTVFCLVLMSAQITLKLMLNACGYDPDEEMANSLLAEFVGGMEEELSFEEFSAMLRSLDSKRLFDEVSASCPRARVCSQRDDLFTWTNAVCDARLSSVVPRPQVRRGRVGVGRRRRAPRNACCVWPRARGGRHRGAANADGWRRGRDRAQ